MLPQRMPAQRKAAIPRHCYIGASDTLYDRIAVLGSYIGIRNTSKLRVNRLGNR